MNGVHHEWCSLTNLLVPIHSRHDYHKSSNSTGVALFQFKMNLVSTSKGPMIILQNIRVLEVSWIN
jgi:hypothetical protein